MGQMTIKLLYADANTTNTGRNLVGCKALEGVLKEATSGKFCDSSEEYGWGFRVSVTYKSKTLTIAECEAENAKFCLVMDGEKMSMTVLRISGGEVEIKAMVYKVHLWIWNRHCWRGQNDSRRTRKIPR